MSTAAAPLIQATDVSALEWPAFAGFDTATQTSLLNAGSLAVSRACDRILGQSSQEQIYTPGRQDSFRLREWPVSAVASVRAGLITALSIANVNPAVQRATVAFTVSGTDPINLGTTGLSLWSIASGVTTTTPFLFANYATLASLATAVNSVSGWQAVVNPTVDPSTGGWGYFAPTDLLADMGAQQAKAPIATSATTPAGARLKMFSRDLRYGLDIDGASRVGRITLFEALPDGYRYPDRMMYGGYGGIGGGGGVGFGGLSNSIDNDGWGCDPRIGGVQVSYVAGYDTGDVPGDLKQLTVQSAKFLYESTKVVGRYESETLADYSYRLADMKGQPLPANVIAGLDSYIRKELI